MVGGAALEAGTCRKIVGADGLIIAVGQRCSGWSIASALLPVVFPAFQLGEELFPVLDAIQGTAGNVVLFGLQVDFSFLQSSQGP